jgi:mannose-6-phosphate isomerase-like protein (cupin superfamily)
MGVDIAWRPHKRQGAKERPLFKIFHLNECPTNPMEPGRGEPRGKHHHHTNADNVYIVKRGEGTLTIEDKTYAVRENDVIYIPAGMRHSLSNLSNDVFEIFEIYAPSGKHMDFVLDE